MIRDTILKTGASGHVAAECIYSSQHKHGYPHVLSVNFRRSEPFINSDVPVEKLYVPNKTLLVRVVKKSCYYPASFVATENFEKRRKQSPVHQRMA